MERPVEVDNDLAPHFRPDQTIDDDKRAWCAAMLADLPPAITFRAVRVQVGRDEAGMWFRSAFGITVVPGHRFLIHIHAGASPADLKHAEDLIERAKRGWFNPDIWEPATFKSGDSGYRLSCFWSWSGAESSDELRPCTMPGCDAEYHVYRGGDFNCVHRAGEDIETEHYDITLRNYEDEDKWAPYIDLTTDMPAGPAGLKIFRDAANDYAWMQAEADKLNALAAEVSVR